MVAVILFVSLEASLRDTVEMPKWITDQIARDFPESELHYSTTFAETELGVRIAFASASAVPNLEVVFVAAPEAFGSWIASNEPEFFPNVKVIYGPPLEE